MPVVPTPSADQRIEDVAAIAKYPLFAALAMREIGLLLEVLEEIDVPSGGRIVDEGHEGAAYFVLEGEAQMTHGTRTVRSLKSGDCFGELSLVSVRPSTETVRASTPMRVARLSRASYAALADRHMALALHLTQSLAARLAETLATMRDCAPASAQKRALSRHTEVTVRNGGSALVRRAGTAVYEFLPTPPAGRVVGALLDNRPVALDTPVVCDATVAPILIGTPEGREIFLRSVGLLLLEAAAEVAPDLRVRWGPPLGPAEVLRIDGQVRDTAALVASLDRAVRGLISRRVPFREETWSVEEARRHFERGGWDDAAGLLRARKEPVVTLVSCGSVVAPSMGPMVQTAAEIGHVRLLPHADGVLVDLEEHISELAPGDRHDTRIDPVLQELDRPRFGGEMATAHRTWVTSLGLASVGRFNEACVSGRVAEVVRVSEGFHEKRIGQVADAIAARRSSVRVIQIAGPSSSGKTTFIKRLTVQLEIDGLHPVSLSLDDYYVDRERTPRDEHGEYDFESVGAIDRALLGRDVAGLLRGDSVRPARFDFPSGRSLPGSGPSLRLEPGDVLVVEGLHGLDRELISDCVASDAVFGIFIHPATTIPFDRLNGVATEDLRLLRRIVRDRRTRGYSAADNILRWPAVRRAEQVHVFPRASTADVVFDSALVYELSVLKVFAERYLLEVPDDHAAFPTALRLRTLIDPFVAIHPQHVPPTSILREFIGGSGFEY